MKSTPRGHEPAQYPDQVAQNIARILTDKDVKRVYLEGPSGIGLSHGALWRRFNGMAEWTLTDIERLSVFLKVPKSKLLKEN
jgi:hypothetical protein